MNPGDEFKELQSRTIDRKGCINLKSPDDVNSIGKFLMATVFENSYGKSLPSIYYDNGIKEFDNYLDGVNEYEYGFSFNIIRFLNAVIFLLHHPQKGNVSFALWPHRILKYETFENETVEVIRENKITNMFSSGAWGEGALGVISSIAVGKILEKIQGIQTTQVDGVRYRIHYLDENDKLCYINFHSSKKSSVETSLFIVTCIPGDDESTTLKSASSSNKNCYIATACYGSIDSYEVNIFRYYRDKYLANQILGRYAIKIYYIFSPLFIKFFGNYSFVNSLIRKCVLDKILKQILNKIKKEG